MDQIASLLKPFLKALALSGQSELCDRMLAQIFTPLLQSNFTHPGSDDESSSEEENLAKVDGGKLSKKSRKAVMA